LQTDIGVGGLDVIDKLCELREAGILVDVHGDQRERDRENKKERETKKNEEKERGEGK
jgi:hypothetical protein